MKRNSIIKLFSILALASAGAFVVGSSLKSKKVESAEAGDATRLYLDMSAFTDWYGDSASFKVHTWNSANGDKYFTATKVADAYYYCDVDLATYASGGGYRFSRYNSTGATEWNQGAWNSYAVEVNTYYRADGYTDGSWSTENQATWTVVGATNGVWAGLDEDISFSLTMRFNNEGLSFYNTSVNLTAGSVFKVKKGNWDAGYGYNAIETGAGSVIADEAVSGENDSNITVVKSGSYEIYMKPFAGKFWMQENSEVSATNWSTSFLNQTNSICSANGTSANHLTALQGVWSGIKDSFDVLTMGARNIIKTGTANATVKDAHDRYVHIIERYGETLDAFDDWTVSPARVLSFVNEQGNKTNLIVIITVIALVSISATGALIFFKKRKTH